MIEPKPGRFDAFKGEALFMPGFVALALSGNRRANLSATPSRRSAMVNSITPPSEMILPPSKAAQNFLSRTDGNGKAAILSSVWRALAGRCAKGGREHPNARPQSGPCATLANLEPARREYEGPNCTAACRGTMLLPNCVESCVPTDSSRQNLPSTAYGGIDRNSKSPRRST